MVVVRDEKLNGCFSPRVFSLQPLVSDASECRGMGLIMAQALGSEKGGDVDVAVPLSSESDRLVVPIGDGVDKLGALTSLPGAIVARRFVIFSLSWLLHVLDP